MPVPHFRNIPFPARDGCAIRGEVSRLPIGGPLAHAPRPCPGCHCRVRARIRVRVRPGRARAPGCRPPGTLGVPAGERGRRAGRRRPAVRLDRGPQPGAVHRQPARLVPHRHPHQPGPLAVPGRGLVAGEIAGGVRVGQGSRRQHRALARQFPARRRLPLRRAGQPIVKRGLRPAAADPAGRRGVGLGPGRTFPGGTPAPAHAGQAQRRSRPGLRAGRAHRTGARQFHRAIHGHARLRRHGRGDPLHARWHAAVHERAALRRAVDRDEQHATPRPGFSGGPSPRAGRGRGLDAPGLQCRRVPVQPAVARARYLRAGPPGFGPGVIRPRFRA